MEGPCGDTKRSPTGRDELWWCFKSFAYSKHPCWKVGVGKGGCEMTIRKEFSVSTRPVVLHVASMMGGEGRDLGQCGEPQVPAASWVQK